jgi:bifunctional non-homologous end joining protein LigD
VARLVGMFPFDHRELMFPTLHRHPFNGRGWLFETKLDGLRCLALKSGGEIFLMSRRGASLTPNFPEIVAGLQTLPDGTVLDAEIVVAGDESCQSFERVRRRARLKSPASIAISSHVMPAALCVFDVLHMGSKDVRGIPLFERKQLISKLLQKAATGIQNVAHVEARGEALYAQVLKLGAEGIVAKYATSTYEAGRQRTWLKIENPDFSRQVPQASPR